MDSGETAQWSVPQRDAAAPRDDPAKANVLLGVTGSVAAIRAKILYDALKERYNVRVVATESALNFLETIEGFDPAVVFRDRDEWASWKGVGDAVLQRQGLPTLSTRQSWQDTGCKSNLRERVLDQPDELEPKLL